MNVIQVEKIIPPEPERRITKTKYIASDGKEFWFKRDCQLYEEKLEIESHPVFKSAIKNVREFREDYYATLYYISSEEDYSFLITHLHIKYFSVNHWEDNFGPGWYLYYSSDGGDGPDSYYLYYLDEYCQGIKKEFDTWYNNIKLVCKRSAEC